MTQLFRMVINAAKKTSIGAVMLVGVGAGATLFAQDKVATPTLAPLQPTSAGAMSDAHWHASLSVDGLLVIRLLSISADYAITHPAPATPLVLTRGGTIVNAAKSGPNGIAQISRLREGTHSLIAVGPGGIGSIGLYVAPGIVGSSHTNLDVSELALIPLSEAKLLRSLIAQRSTQSAAVIGQVVPENELATLTTGQIPQYSLRADGTLSGRFVSLERMAARVVPNLRVVFIRQGKILADATTDELGYFHVAANLVAPGDVSVVALGANGYAIYGAEVVKSTSLSQHGQLPDGTYPIAFQGEGTSSTTMSVSDPASLGVVDQALEEQVENETAPAGVTSATGAAGSGAGTGGGGGGGGGGGLLGLAGLGLGAAALGVALDKNNDNRPASPSSP